jgi:hypothetical protein
MYLWAIHILYDLRYNTSIERHRFVDGSRRGLSGRPIWGALCKRATHDVNRDRSSATTTATNRILFYHGYYNIYCIIIYILYYNIMRARIYKICVRYLIASHLLYVRISVYGEENKREDEKPTRRECLILLHRDTPAPHT